MRTLDVRTTRRAEFVEITADVRRAVADAGLRDGVCVVYCPKTAHNANPCFSSGFSSTL